MSKAKKAVFFAGAVYLFALAFTPENKRAGLRAWLGIPKGVEDFLLGQKVTIDTQEEQTVKQPDPAPKETLATGQLNFPKNRALTLNEMYALAVYVTERYGILTTYPGDLVTFAFVESSFRPWVSRNEGFDSSYGLMQVLLGTAKDMYARGYTSMGAPTSAKLKDPVVSMYFGAAYLQWMKLNYRAFAYAYVDQGGRYDDFFIRAYNGGPGWQKTANGPKNTEAYLKKWRAAYEQYGRNAIGVS